MINYYFILTIKHKLLKRLQVLSSMHAVKRKDEVQAINCLGHVEYFYRFLNLYASYSPAVPGMTSTYFQRWPTLNLDSV